MENCQQIFELLSQYLDLELPPDACRDIEGHIAGCAPCVQFVESLRSAVELCRKYKPDELPPPIGDEARERLTKAWREMLAGGKPEQS